MFISLMLKFDTVQPSVYLSWWDNAAQTHGCEPPSPPPRLGSAGSDSDQIWSRWKRMILSIACLFLSTTTLVILWAGFIGIHCSNFQLVNWIGDKTRREMHGGTKKKKNKRSRKLNWKFSFIISRGMGWASDCKLIHWGVPELSFWEISCSNYLYTLKVCAYVWW